jgi:hypothetical protein
MGYGKPPKREDERMRAGVRIVDPPDGSRYVIDPETPRSFQTLALRAEVVPAVSEVVWLVDGEEFERVSYPYEIRWSLEEGEHTFQVRFPNAGVSSEVISIHITPF